MRVIDLGVSCGMELMGSPPGLILLRSAQAIYLNAFSDAFASRLLLEWDVPDEFGWVDVARCLLANPNVWTHGSLVLDSGSG